MDKYIEGIAFSQRFSLEESKNIMAFYQSDAGKWHVNTILEVVREVLDSSVKPFGKHLGELIQKKKSILLPVEEKVLQAKIDSPSLQAKNMSQDMFESRWSHCKSLPGEGDQVYKTTWAKVGIHPLDRRLTEFVRLYQASNDEQRQIIKDYFEGKQEQLWELVLYIRRVGMRIQSEDDGEWVRAGLTAAVIVGDRDDFRDVIYSLSILRYAAERQGIHSIGYFDEMINSLSPEEPINKAYRGGILQAVRDKSHYALIDAVIRFGPEEWIYEDNLVIDGWLTFARSLMRVDP